MLCISDAVRDLAALLDQSDTGVLESAYRDMLAAQGAGKAAFELVVGDDTEECAEVALPEPHSREESVGPYPGGTSSGRQFVGEWDSL